MKNESNGTETQQNNGENETPSESVNTTPPIISLQEAAERGENKYFTGVPCKHGHVSERYVVSNCCLACLKISSKKPRPNKKELARRYYEMRKKLESSSCSFCNAPIPKKGRVDRIYCSKKCRTKAQQKLYVIRHADKEQARRLAQDMIPAQRMFYRVKARAKNLNIPFNLDKEDILIPETCPVLGIAIDPWPRNSKRNRPDSPSLDRIIPEEGYVKGNVRVISNRANLLKSNASSEEMFKIYLDLKRIESEKG